MADSRSWRRAARRAVRRLHHTLRGSRTPFLYDPSYRRGLGGAPLDRLRSERVLSFLYDEGLIRRSDIVTPQPASLEHILRVHSAEYLRRLEEPGVVDEIIGGTLTQDRRRQGVELQRLMAGATVQATRLALQTGDIAIHTGGGLHHATREQGLGFCIFNDIAIAIARLRSRHFNEPILVVDLDLHDGNGTRVAFADDPTVYTYSIHNAPWDDTANQAVASTSIALGTRVDDATYLATLRETLPPVIAQHRPGLVIYVAGCDVAQEDVLGDWLITADGILERDRFVVEQLQVYERRLPIAILVGGGYGNSAWRYSARFFTWLLSGEVVEPPDDLEVALRRFHQVGTLLREPEEKKRDAWLDLELTEEDLLGVSPDRHAPRRLMGQFGQRQIEALMERAGILEQIRGRGYAEPRVELEPLFGLGETVRVFGDAGHSELLMELRAGRDRRLVPDMELMWIEWLLLQNPRADFPPNRPPLPGQEHPGLGILADVFVWLIISCREAGLDGVAFRTAHFHVATLAVSRFRFLRPDVHLRFEALRDATAGMTLSEASHAVNDSRLVEAATGQPVFWPEATMVLPVTDRLEEWLDESTIREATRSPPLPRYELRTGEQSSP